MIRELRIRRFKSIPGEHVMLANPTFIVGQNGSGKSNFADLFAFLADAMVVPLQAAFDRRGGISAVRNRRAPRGYPASLGISVVLAAPAVHVVSARYAFEISAERNYGFAVKGEECEVRTAAATYRFERSGGEFVKAPPGLRPALEPSALALPLVGGDERFAPVYEALAGMRVYSIEPAQLREMQEPDSGVRLNRDGSNAASVLDEIRRRNPQDMQRIREILSTVVPGTTAVRTRKLGNKLTLLFDQQWGAKEPMHFEAFSMSDGTLRTVGLLAAAYQMPRPTLLVIEEPEATIHPGALGAVLDLIRHASRHTQVIVTTHSPDVLDAEWIEDEHIRIASWERGVTRITPMGDSSRAALQNHLMGAGELLRSNALSPPEGLARDGSDLQLRLFEGRS